MYLRPVVADSIGKDISITIESTGRDWLFYGFRCLQFCPSIFIPETESAITSNCSQRPVGRVERYGIHL